jgi:hypothetical protein
MFHAALRYNMISTSHSSPHPWSSFHHPLQARGSDSGNRFRDISRPMYPVGTHIHIRTAQAVSVKGSARSARADQKLGSPEPIFVSSS